MKLGRRITLRTVSSKDAHVNRFLKTGVVRFIILVAVAIVMRADDWPEIRGKGRLGVWNETGIVDKFPESGLKVLWRTPVKGGYSGPAVADGRVFLMDLAEKSGNRGT
jgi:hypothetical protein